MIEKPTKSPINRIIRVDWWMYSYKSDGYEDYSEDVTATSNEEAIAKMKRKHPRGKTFTV